MKIALELNTVTPVKKLLKLHLKTITLIYACGLQKQ